MSNTLLLPMLRRNGAAICHVLSTKTFAAARQNAANAPGSARVQKYEMSHESHMLDMFRVKFTTARERLRNN
ncbi:hypothetical protein ACG3SL_00340 [Sphingomonas sp. CJ20]